MNHNFVNIKELKTYSRRRTNKTSTNETTSSENIKQEDNLKVPLNTRNAVEYLMQGTLKLRVCRYCLNVTSKLSEFDEVLTLAIGGPLHEVTIRDIVASFHPYKVAEDPNFPNKICNECVNRAINCYLFTQQCERAERAMRNCFEDIYDKLEKLDSLEPIKRRGKRKLHPNHDMIYAEHAKVMCYAEPIINIVNITNNISVQSNNKINVFECQKCWQVLPNMESLINHENSHPKSMWFNCRLCGKSFVKRSHLRKHFKETHKYVEESNDESKVVDFKCNECGLDNESLGEHLQHNEKHKFKSLVKSLIERKVDTLCTVCMDKSSCLMNLSDTVNLCGGYPEATGEKSIENILTAAIPGPNHYKYEELILPHKAKIIKLTKRKLNLNEKSQEINKKLVFTTPILVNKNSFAFTSSVTFTFSKPYLPYPVEGSNKITINNPECDVNGENAVVDDFNIEMSSLNEMFMDDKNKTNNKSELTRETTSCKICWIFKTPNCKSCLKKDTLIVKNEKSDVIMKNDCNFCWIFGKTGKCNFCIKYIDCSDKVCSNTTDIGNILDLQETDGKLLQKATSLSIKKQETWLCNVCLTNNTKARMTCICCDGENYLNENVKASLDSRYSFTRDISNILTSDCNGNSYLEVNATNYDKKCSDVVTDNKDYKLLDNNAENNLNPLSYFLNKTLNDINDSKLCINIENNELSNNKDDEMCLPVIDEEDSKMEVDIEQYAIDNINSINIVDQHDIKSSIVEEMDVAFDYQPTKLTTNFLNIQSPSNQYAALDRQQNDFQPQFIFCIGAHDSKDNKNRRTRRALRRIATKSYK